MRATRTVSDSVARIRRTSGDGSAERVARIRRAFGASQPSLLIFSDAHRARNADRCNLRATWTVVTCQKRCEKVHEKVNEKVNDNVNERRVKNDQTNGQKHGWKGVEK